MNCLACLAGFIVLCSFGSPVDAHAGGNMFVGKKFVVTNHKPAHFVHQPHIFVPTPVLTKTFVAPPFIPPYGYMNYYPTYMYPHYHYGVMQPGVPWGGSGVIVVK